MDSKIRELIDTDHITKEFRLLFQEGRELVKSQKDAFLHGEGVEEGRETIIWEIQVMKNPEEFILQIPSIMDAQLRALITLIARNNARLIKLMGLALDK